MDAMSSGAANAIRRVVEDLVRGDYTRLEADGHTGRLSAEVVERLVREYGRTLVPLPSSAFDAAGVYPQDDDPRWLYVDLGLWTAEEGRSDLTLQLRVFDAGDESLVVIHDLHVL